MNRCASIRIPLILVFVVAATLSADRAPAGPVTLKQQWSGSRDDLEQIDAPTVITDQEQWKKLFESWKFADKLPVVDFKQEIAITATTRGSRLRLSATLDDRGNLRVLGLATRDLRPGFRFVVATLDRQGIKSVEGKKLSAKNQQRASSAGFRLNLTFGTDPGDGAYDGVIGDPHDRWNLIDVGQRAADGLVLADGSKTVVNASVSENDGEWGIKNQAGVYHAYIYHNNLSVDISCTVHALPPGLYDVYVLAHGDAPNQNAAIEIQSGLVKYSGKSTLNDGTWNYRSPEYEDGVQFVRYTVEVHDDTPLVITARRDGSSYAMLNAIQLARLAASDHRPATNPLSKTLTPK